MTAMTCSWNWRRRARFVLVPVLLTGLLACSEPADTTIVANANDVTGSESLRSITLLRDLALETIAADGRAPSYEEALAALKPEGFSIVSGASRDGRIVSMELERAPRGELPLAVELGRDCLIVRILYPAPNASVAVDKPTESWFLVRDYVRNTARIPSAICSGQATFGMDFDDVDGSGTSARPVVLD